MPASRSIGNGSEQIAKANASQRYTDIAVGAGATVTLDPIQVIGLPNLVFWGRISAGVVAPTVTLQFCVSSVASGGVPSYEWLDWPGPFILPVTLRPVQVPWFMPCRFIRASIVGGAGACTVQAVLAGSA